MLPLEALERVDRVCAAFEAAWKAAGKSSGPPEIDRFLGNTAEPERTALLEELLLIDLEYRRGAGKLLAPEAYHARFSDHRQVVISALGKFRPADSGTSTSSSLLERVKAGDQDAWSRFVDFYGPLVYAWCHRDGLQPADTADVVQEVFRCVMAGIARFRRESPQDTFRGWLRTITQNQVRDRHRAQRRRPEARGGTDAQERLLQVPDGDPGKPAESSPATPASPVIHSALDRVRGDFEPRTWKAFWMATFENRCSADIGAELGMTANAVRRAKARVLGRLREELSGLIE